MLTFDRLRERVGRLLAAPLGESDISELRNLLCDAASLPEIVELARRLEGDDPAIDRSRGYARVQLIREGRAELTLVVVRCGEKIRCHDHGRYPNADDNVGFVFVVRGTETNRFYRLASGGIEEIGSRVMHAGDSLVVTASTIHCVENDGPETVVSLNAYIHAQDDSATGKVRY